jgi:hypothetical protein
MHYSVFNIIYIIFVSKLYFLQDVKIYDQAASILKGYLGAKLRALTQQ